jgi:NAD(P)-dependent dehydrogenase (short-subunit alcohol dehydrogenase family)
MTWHKRSATARKIRMDINGKVVVLTGGASGIGRALCERFAQEGARGAVVADLDEVRSQAGAVPAR